MKFSIISFFAICIVAIHAFSQSEKEAAFTSAVTFAYREHDLKSIISLYHLRGATAEAIEAEKLKWKTSFTIPRVEGATFQSVDFVPVSTIKEWSNPSQKQIEGQPKGPTAKAIESHQRFYASLTQPTEREGVLYNFNLPVCGIIVVRYSLGSNVIGGYSYPVGFDTNGSLRFPLQVP